MFTRRFGEDRGKALREMCMASIWMDAVAPEFAPLNGNLRTDVLVIGGGLAGILCAHLLRQAGVDCALVEAGRLCGGNTGNTTAKLTLQHGLIYDKLIKDFGLEKAQMYLQANRAALDVYRSLCMGMDCDFEEKDNFVYSLDDRAKLEREVRALERLGQPARLADELPLPIRTAGAVMMPDQAQFHPLKFAYAIAKDLPVYEKTRVLELVPGWARTACGTIRAGKIIVATHFPLLNKHGGYFLKLYQHRSYVMALEGAQDVRGMYVDEDEKGLSFRNHGDLLLLGGGSHRTGKQGGGWRELEQFAGQHYPSARPVARWAAQDCISLDSMPYVGQYSRRTPGLYVATGFNKWGMTGSMAGALLLRDMLLDRPNPWGEVFSPLRSMLRPQLAANAAEAALNLITPTAPRCPHMGCALKYNPQEHSWDCPCHGSRFEEGGRVIDNPANGGLKR